jgi:hypothetical protein
MGLKRVIWLLVESVGEEGGDRAKAPHSDPSRPLNILLKEGIIGDNLSQWSGDIENYSLDHFPLS